MATGIIQIMLQNKSGKIQVQTVDVGENCLPGTELQTPHCPDNAHEGSVVKFKLLELPNGMFLAVNVELVI